MAKSITGLDDFGRICAKCKLYKARKNFHKSNFNPSRMQSRCKSCVSNADKIRWSDDRETERKRCKRWQQENAEYVAKKGRLWRSNNLEKGILARVKQRAKRKGSPFTLTVKDIKIPEYCPVLGIKLHNYIQGPLGEGRPFDDSPSIDAIVPEKGYVSGNVAIISFRANRIKSDATSKELYAVAKWLEKHECPNQ